MFETDQFVQQLTNTIAREAANRGMEKYETAIVNFLQTLATDNESALFEDELKKPVGLRRGVPDALQSARSLVEVAVNFARADKSTTLRLSDMRHAWAASYCRIWPFCR